MRESRSLGSVGAKAEWLSYPTTFRTGHRKIAPGGSGNREDQDAEGKSSPGRTSTRPSRQPEGDHPLADHRLHADLRGHAQPVLRSIPMNDPRALLLTIVGTGLVATAIVIRAVELALAKVEQRLETLERVILPPSDPPEGDRD